MAEPAFDLASAYAEAAKAFGGAAPPLPAANNPPPSQLYTFQTYTPPGQPSFFLYDDPATDLAALPAVAPNFGLRPGVSWKHVVDEVRRLNEDEESQKSGAVYKLIFLGRHGQGNHNVAESKYGTEAWDAKWSFLNGDNELVWGPDPLLTTLGESQADDVNEEWRARLHDPNITDEQARPPIPTRLYVSPFSRALETAKRTYKGLPGVPSYQLIMEGLRETIGGHTCDMRSPKKVIAERYPEPGFVIEPGFMDGDFLFSPIVRETDQQVVDRLRETLSRIFGPASGAEGKPKDVASSEGAQVIGITVHSGVMQAVFQLTGHRFFTPKTGALVPLILKAVPAKK
ncbi:putative phosphoglycerate mutase pmu1 [Tilletia horrida]|nr:putative phosphoglycerate mutase pmu1 [Tilletia horrida]